MVVEDGNEGTKEEEGHSNSSKTTTRTNTLSIYKVVNDDDALVYTIYLA